MRLLLLQMMVELKLQQSPLPPLVQWYALFVVSLAKRMQQVLLVTVEYYTIDVVEYSIDQLLHRFVDA